MVDLQIFFPTYLLPHRGKSFVYNQTEFGKPSEWQIMKHFADNIYQFKKKLIPPETMVYINWVSDNWDSLKMKWTLTATNPRDDVDKARGLR